MPQKLNFLKKITLLEYAFISLVMLIVISLVYGFVFKNKDKEEVRGTKSGAAVRIYEFYSETCPHCQKANGFFETYLNDKPEVDWQKYEVTTSKENNELFDKVANKLKAENDSVPFIVIGDEVYKGFSDQIKDDITKRIDYCTKNSCQDSVAEVLNLPLVANPEVKIETISANDFNKKIENIDENSTILDLRTQKEYDSGYIEGSKLLNFYDENFEKSLNEFDKNKTYYIYCNSGNRSSKTLKIMEKQGFKTVYDLDGGIQAWKTAGFNIK